MRAASHFVGGLVTLASVWLSSPGARGAEDSPRAGPPAGEGPAAGQRTLSAGEADVPISREAAWNELDGRYFTLRIGGGLLLDYTAYAQDGASEEQLALTNTAKLRDFRLLANGKLKFLPRVSYTISYMYDGAFDLWRFRQTGFMLAVDELDGSLFLGRTKEGFSTVRLMVGYNGWTLERSAANDAFLPILADGVKWTASLLDGLLVYNVGGFIDVLTEEQPFNKNDWQVAGRAVLLPLAGARSAVIHLAAEARYGAPDDGLLQFRSKPEAFAAEEYAVDTGEIPAAGHTIFGGEAYVAPGPFVFGAEYYVNSVATLEMGDLLFHGGEAFASVVLGGKRPYNGEGAFFEAVVPTRTIPDAGPGALELVLRYSYVDLDDGPVEGGTFWRLTPVASWYVSENLRFEAAYGYGVLDRFGLVGGTHFFQTRAQLTLN